MQTLKKFDSNPKHDRKEQKSASIFFVEGIITRNTLSIMDTVIEDNTRGNTETTNSNMSFYSVCHLNVQSKSNKINFLDFFTNKYSPDILCVSEQRVFSENLSIACLTNYCKVRSFSRSNHLHGGVAIFVKNNILSLCNQLRFLFSMSKELSFESCVIIVVY